MRSADQNLDKQIKSINVNRSKVRIIEQKLNKNNQKMDQKMDQQINS